MKEKFIDWFSVLLVFAFIFAAAWMTFPSWAFAQEHALGGDWCYPAEEALANLKEKGLPFRSTAWQGSTVVAVHRSADGKVWELWQWTAERGCFIAGGTHWTEYDAQGESVPVR